MIFPPRYRTMGQPAVLARLRPRAALGGGAVVGPSVIIVPMLGQSNMVGRNAQDGTEPITANTYQYGGDATKSSTYQKLTALTAAPLDYTEGLDRVGPGMSILARMRTDNPTAMLVAVPVAVGSTAMVAGATPRWAPGNPGGDLFETAISQTNGARAAVLALYPSASIRYEVVISQGEQDAALFASTSAWQTAFTSFVSLFRSRVTGASTARFTIGSMLPQKWTIGDPNYLAEYAAINLAQVQASVALTSVDYAKGPTLAVAENLHYQPASDAQLYGTYIALSMSDVTGPTVTSASTNSNTVSNTLAFALTGSDTHQTFHINGGADAAQFQISDPYLTPTLQWASNGTGPVAGTYVVGIRARDGSGNYGATQTFTQTVAASGAVSPTTFFTASERGMVWDLSNLANMSQTIDGLTPVTTAGQSVGWVKDLSPNANHWIAGANDTTRPTYQVDSDGKPYVSFDGTNDILFAATPFITTTNGKYSVCMGAFGASPAATKYLLGAYSTASGTPFMVPLSALSGGNATPTMRNDAGAGAGTMPALTTSFDNATKRVISSHYNGTNSTVRMRDGASRPAGGGTGSYSSQTQGTFANNFAVTRSALGGLGFATPASWFAGRIYSGYVINRYVTDAEVKSGEDWVAAKVLTAALP